MAARKNSLVANINRRKKAGKSRPKSRSTIAPDAYEAMQEGWPKRRKKKAAGKRKAAGTRKATKKAASKRTRANAKARAR